MYCIDMDGGNFFEYGDWVQNSKVSILNIPQAQVSRSFRHFLLLNENMIMCTRFRRMILEHKYQVELHDLTSVFYLFVFITIKRLTPDRIQKGGYLLEMISCTPTLTKSYLVIVVEMRLGKRQALTHSHKL